MYFHIKYENKTTNPILTPKQKKEKASSIDQRNTTSLSHHFTTVSTNSIRPTPLFALFRERLRFGGEFREFFTLLRSVYM